VTAEQTRSVVGRYFDFMNGGGASIAGEILSSEIVFVGPVAPDGIRGREAFIEFVATMRSASPDLRFVEHERVAEGELMATRFTMSATHAVEKHGMRLFSTDGMDLFQLRNGKIERISAYFDRLALAEQANVPTVDTR
jgi:steroid delta-isomerase-like uncharacterized protein